MAEWYVINVPSLSETFSNRLAGIVTSLWLNLRVRDVIGPKKLCGGFSMILLLHLTLVSCYHQTMPKRMPPEVLEYLRRLGKAYGKLGGKTAAKNMTAAERKARAKKASVAAAKKRTAQRLARERQGKLAKTGAITHIAKNPTA